MKKLVIFDLDGTLLNTIADLGHACNYALREMGFAEHALTTYNYMVGNGVRKLVERAEPDASPEEVDKLLNLFREYYDQHSYDHTKPYPGIPELLADLNEAGVALAVTSNKYEAAVKRIVAHFFPDIPFVAFLGQVEGRPTKPDPSVVFAVINAHPVPKHDILYVGDSAVDMDTARRACIESVGVSWGFRPVSELHNAYADHVVNNPSEIYNIAVGSGSLY